MEPLLQIGKQYGSGANDQTPADAPPLLKAVGRPRFETNALQPLDELHRFSTNSPMTEPVPENFSQFGKLLDDLARSGIDSNFTQTSSGKQSPTR
jgi:hypothetical protein